MCKDEHGEATLGFRKFSQPTKEGLELLWRGGNLAMLDKLTLFIAQIYGQLIAVLVDSQVQHEWRSFEVDGVWSKKNTIQLD